MQVQLCTEPTALVPTSRVSWWHFIPEVGIVLPPLPRIVISPLSVNLPDSPQLFNCAMVELGAQCVLGVYLGIFIKHLRDSLVVRMPLAVIVASLRTQQMRELRPGETDQLCLETAQ